MVEFGYIGPALTLADSGAVIRVDIVNWVRPYGIPYAQTATGTEYHISAMHYWDEPAPAVV